MNVVYLGSREIYADFETAIRSLLAHNPTAQVWTLTEDPDPFPDLPVNNIVWRCGDWFNATNTRTKWKHFGTTRAALSKVLPIDRVISIDVDTIVLGDISELWTMDLHGRHVAMCREERMSNWLGRPYYNAGVSVMDLALIRQEGVDDRMIEELNRTEFTFVAQDVIQKCCRILDLDSRWNDCKFTAPCFDPVILHFADRTDWRELPVVKQYRK